ncbi:peroxisomal 2,4-dienoyl-CoA reductase [(3E)-enoyl-CoA-producing] isoform X4 [Manis javanica]|uniref:peroxisomal 2,4-dienoyl-CoA reductase [(3E)-enoyl-CoA-producing] isoform X4 n=1 Tax=Manis javanica TaxID=9974 RepID=UPI00187981DC|nr:peroxisomal 2,4-dienoyl-CoA reductase isoform X2 [Manis javanica]
MLHAPYQAFSVNIGAPAPAAYSGFRPWRRLPLLSEGLGGNADSSAPSHRHPQRGQAHGTALAPAAQSRALSPSRLRGRGGRGFRGRGDREGRGGRGGRGVRGREDREGWGVRGSALSPWRLRVGRRSPRAVRPCLAPWPSRRPMWRRTTASSSTTTSSALTCFGTKWPSSLAAARGSGSGLLRFLCGAAGNFLCPASVLSFNAFKTVMDIDALGTFNVSRDHGGVIVNITATLGTRGQVLQVHAGSAKAAVDAMTRHLAVEWGPQNIRVNSLAPGPISGTEGFRRLGGSQASTSMDVLASPLRRLGNKTEVAHSALYLASPLASYVTGAVLVVDGGAWLTFPNDVKLLEDFASSAKL